MKEMRNEIEYKDKKYLIVFNINVMEAIQQEYGTVQKWGELTEGKKGEADIKAITFAFNEMINEGIDILNEENGTDIKPFTKKQTGRLLTEIGLENVSQTINETVIESTKSETKNA